MRNAGKAWRRWWGVGASSAGQVVDLPIAAMLGILHIGVVLQLCLCMASLIHDPHMVWQIWVMTAAAIACSSVIAVWMFTHRSYRLPWGLGAVHLAITVMALVVQGIYMPRRSQLGDWDVWAPAYADLTVATLPAWISGAALAIGVGAGVAAVYVAVVLPGNADLLSSVTMNVVGYMMFVVAAVILLRVARHMAEQVERSHSEAVRLVGELRIDRYLFHMHNASGLLARLSRDDIPDSMMPALRMQAAREASRLRVAMTSRPESGSQRWSLGRVIANATSGFGHLPLEVNDLLGRHVMLPIHQAMAVQMALITVLYNVQFHARATEVTIHAEDHGDWWEVSVADDGVGFDPSAVHYGFGLRHQVVEPLRSEGLAVTVTSAPGEGTVVMMRSCPDGTSHAGWN
ncbi:putative histidine kinase [Bifidobacterium minimum]|uniref:Putative histidine kinase n=1 Tax=Bifidobacterium minimum TaxID=1693 RepID=A0A087BNG3_9BIFI|nr:ATP-binding protein [Bifidobacterium minimum]KFI72563.1 putative histidine kinase [Bifidobacterium minimum]MCH4158678.1 ATP-binding protein [Bifidobacterium minimum]